MMHVSTTPSPFFLNAALYGAALVCAALLVALAGCGGDQAEEDVAAGAEAAGEEEAGGHGDDWSYLDDGTGPAQWASLSEDYEDCTGDAQSPINVAGTQPADSLQALETAYQPAEAELDAEQYVTHVDLDDAGTLTFQGKEYELAQFHFHTPSEHTVEGQSFPAEMHLVHEGEDDQLAVIGVMIEEGNANGALDPVLSPRGEGGEEDNGDVQIDAGQLLPGGGGYYTYSGSLTTPPCTEGVRWILMQEPLELSSQQLEQLKGDQTNRPVQGLGDRTVLAYEE